MRVGCARLLRGLIEAVGQGGEMRSRQQGRLLGHRGEGPEDLRAQTAVLGQGGQGRQKGLEQLGSPASDPSARSTLH